MCDSLREDKKCCGACDRTEADERIRCEICDTLRSAEDVTKDWMSPGWSVCDACIGDGDADMALAEHLTVHAILEDSRYLAVKYLEKIKMFEGKY